MLTGSQRQPRGARGTNEHKLGVKSCSLEGFACSVVLALFSCSSEKPYMRQRAGESGREWESEGDGLQLSVSTLGLGPPSGEEGGGVKGWLWWCPLCPLECL